MNLNKIKDEIYYTLKAYNGGDPKLNNELAELVVGAILPMITVSYEPILKYLEDTQKDMDTFNDPSYPEFTRFKREIESIIRR